MPIDIKYSFHDSDSTITFRRVLLLLLYYCGTAAALARKKTEASSPQGRLLSSALSSTGSLSLCRSA